MLGLQDHGLADGNLVEFHLKWPAFARTTFQFFIVDEAQTARNPSGTFNQAFRLFKMKSLV